MPCAVCKCGLKDGCMELPDAFDVDVEACGRASSRVCVSSLLCAAGHRLPASSKMIVAKVAYTNLWVLAYLFCRAFP